MALSDYQKYGHLTDLDFPPWVRNNLLPPIQLTKETRPVRKVDCWYIEETSGTMAQVTLTRP